jgi:hypothetical protein
MSLALLEQVQVPVCTKATTPKPVGCKPGYKRVSGKCYQCSAGTYSPDGKTCRLRSVPVVCVLP